MKLLKQLLIVLTPNSKNLKVHISLKTVGKQSGITMNYA